MKTNIVILLALIWLVEWVLAIWAGYWLGGTKGRRWDGLVLGFFLNWLGVVITAIINDPHFGRQ
jgi:hypothetical protein